MAQIRLAVAGVGNCASSLVQGLAWYAAREDEGQAEPVGLRHVRLGGYRVSDIVVVAAFDVDARKVGRPLEEAILARIRELALSRVPDADAAYSQRDKRYNISALAIWEKDSNPQRHIQWARDFAARIEPLSGGGAAYVNYLNDDADAAAVRGAYGGEKYQRLRALKAKYDPQNVFRYNQNIPPA